MSVRFKELKNNISPNVFWKVHFDKHLEEGEGCVAQEIEE